jgi:hypothetical protein
MDATASASSASRSTEDAVAGSTAASVVSDAATLVVLVAFVVLVAGGGVGDPDPLALGDAEDDTRLPASCARAFTYTLPVAVAPTRTTEATPA